MLAPAAALMLLGCGGNGAPFVAPTTPTGIAVPAAQLRMLLDVTVMVRGGDGCNVGSNPQEFTGEAGTTVTIEATGPAAMTPSIVVFAPDWATQLTGSRTSGPGTQTLTTTPPDSGTHRVEVCAINSVGGATRIRVTAPMP